MEEMYVQRANDFRSQGYNCAQAVACAFVDLLDIDENTLRSLTTGFGGGMGGNDGTCGALSGALVVLSLFMSSQKKSKEEISASAKELFDTFVHHDGSSVCKELKGTDTGIELTSCANCIIDATRITYRSITS